MTGPQTDSEPSLPRIELIRAAAELDSGIFRQATGILDDLVTHDAGLGWVDPPEAAEVW